MNSYAGMDAKDVWPSEDSLLADFEGGATRASEGKPGVHRIPAYPLIELAKVYDAGNGIHGEDNWRKGMSWSRVYGPMFRHLLKFMAGSDTDEETGCHHLACVAWGALTILEYTQTHPECDDRPIRKYRVAQITEDKERKE